MAKIVSEVKIVSGALAKYPWDEWFDGNKRLLVQGEDFHKSVYGFRQMIYRAASERGIGVVVGKAGPTSFFVQSYKKS